MAKNKSLSKELKGLGSDLSASLKKMVQSKEFKDMEKDVAAGIRSIATSVGHALRTANKSENAATLRRRLKRVVKAGRTEGAKEAVRARDAALKRIQQVRQKIRKTTPK